MICFDLGLQFFRACLVTEKGLENTDNFRFWGGKRKEGCRTFVMSYEFSFHFLINFRSNQT